MQCPERRHWCGSAGWLLIRIVMASAPMSVGAQESVHPRADSVSVTNDSSRVKPRALAELLADASRRNALPPDLIAYKAQVQTEIAMLLRREEGSEAVGALENVATQLRWTRSGVYDQRVTGYRAQRVGFSFSMLSAIQSGWLNPTLYDNRLRIRARASTPAARASQTMRRDGSDTLPAVHPLATDRDRFYRFSGGDTVVTMRTGNRAIPIVHVRVQPRAGITDRVLLFDGEIDLDVSRGALVRMRGTFVRVNAARRGAAAALAGRLVELIAYIEYENAEREEQYWLPAKQRIELQVTSALAGESRAVLRIVSRFTSLAVNDTVLDAATLANADSLRALGRRRFSYAPRDSVDRFDEWYGGIGTLTSGMHADDFIDIGPDRWRPSGVPRVDVMVSRGADLLHFNRVEGLYTGLGIKTSLRDFAPGVIIRANAGWAWNEGTARGRLAVERTRGAWTTELRGGRVLDNTNDFRTPLDSGPSIGSIIGSTDRYDYVHRRSATVSVLRRLDKQRSLLRIDWGVADDRYRAASYRRSPLWGGKAYRENRGVDQGGYIRSAVVIDLHPDISADFVRPGIGARLAYERGDGTLTFQRAEARLTAREIFGPFTAVARVDGGIVWGNRIPPQQLFELGDRQGLPGYGEKEFAGSRAALIRAQLQYTTPWLRRPIRVTRRLLLPGIAPGVSAGLQGGWTDVRGDAARASLLRLGVRADSSGALVPVARVTGDFRATASAGLRFFSGSVFVGAARAIDHAARWQSLIVFGQQW